MYRILMVFLIVLVLALFLEKLVASEYISFLERDVRIEQSHRNLKKGMNEWEVTNLIGFPPDSVYEQESGEGITVQVWAVKNHVGPLHKFFGIEARDEKSYMELHLDFDKDKRLIRIYYGG